MPQPRCCDPSDAALRGTPGTTKTEGSQMACTAWGASVHPDCSTIGKSTRNLKNLSHTTFWTIRECWRKSDNVKSKSLVARENNYNNSYNFDVFPHQMLHLGFVLRFGAHAARWNLRSLATCFACWTSLEWLGPPKQWGSVLKCSKLGWVDTTKPPIWHLSGPRQLASTSTSRWFLHWILGGQKHCPVSWAMIFFLYLWWWFGVHALMGNLDKPGGLL